MPLRGRHVALYSYTRTYTPAKSLSLLPPAAGLAEIIALED